MSLKDELREARAARQEVGTTLDRKREQRDEVREEKRKKKKRDPVTEERERELDREINQLHKEEKGLTHRIHDLEDRDRTLFDKVKHLAQQIKDKPKHDAVVIQAGSPHWGGCEDIIQNEVIPVAGKWGIGVTSGKRSETFGNPSSDHYTGNATASARDFATATNWAFGVAIGDSLGVPYNGSGSDYVSFYIDRAGRTFRAQLIGSTHGTGPHFHVGLRLV